MNFVDDLELINMLAMAGGDFMTKTRYEKTLQELEQKEGKLYTIPEISNIIRVDQGTIHAHLRLHDVMTFKVRHYKTQQNQTLLPEREVLKIMAKHTPCLPMLKALARIQMLDDGCNSISDVICLLEDLREEA